MEKGKPLGSNLMAQRLSFDCRNVPQQQQRYKDKHFPSFFLYY